MFVRSGADYDGDSDLNARDKAVDEEEDDPREDQNNRERYEEDNWEDQVEDDDYGAEDEHLVNSDGFDSVLNNLETYSNPDAVEL